MQDLFWLHRTVLKSEGLNVGFGTLSLAHFCWFAAMVAGIVAYVIFYRRSGERGRDNIRKASALFIILFEILKQCVVALTGVSNTETLPIELCSLAEYAMLADAMWPEERFFRQPFLLLFLPTATMALVFPTVVDYPFYSFYTIHQFVLHAVIVAYIIARYATGEFRPAYPGIWISMLKLLPVAAFIYWIDVHFDKDYMFLASPHGNTFLGLAWSFTGNRGGLAYVGGLFVLLLAGMHVMYAVYRVIDAIRGKKSNATGGTSNG